MIRGGDSFDHYRNAALTADGVTQKWDGVNGDGVRLSVGEGRYGTTALQGRLDFDSYLIRNFPDGPLSAVGFLIAVRPEMTLGGDNPIILLLDNTTAQLSLVLRADLRFEVRHADGTVLGTATVPVPGSTYAHAEFYVEIANAGGKAQVYVNGDPTPVIDFTGDTQYTGNASASRFYLGTIAHSGIGFIYFDDFLYYDTTGAVHTAPPLGDAHIDKLLSDDDGPTVDWTPDPGTNSENIAENPPDGDTSHNEASVSGDTDLYKFPDVAPPIPADVRILAVLQNIDARKTAGGLEPILPTVRVNGSDYDAPATFEPGSNYHIHQEPWEVDPDTGLEWTLARLNDANAATRAYFGQKIP
jgi:hypothetical protein